MSTRKCRPQNHIYPQRDSQTKMPTQRQSDENSNPDHELEFNPENTAIKLEGKTNKPLILSNEASGKRRLSTFEKKEKTRFEKSGMKKGSLLKYFVKENLEEMQEPAISNRPSTACTNKFRTYSVNSVDNNVSSENEETGAGGSQLSLDSEPEVEYSGPISRNQGSPENGVAISSGSESVGREEFEADSPQVSDYNDGENHVIQEIEPQDVEYVINNLDDQELSSEDKIERWQRQNKRMLQDNEQDAANNSSELQPPPSKTSKYEVAASEILVNKECTPPNSQDSTSTPPLRIVNVYTLSKNDAKAAPSPSLHSVEKAKKSIFIYKETDDSSLASLIQKKNWRKVIEIIRNDLTKYKIPSRFHMSQFIRKAILCEGSRVSKDVQADSVKILEKIMADYPPYNGNGRDPSVKYYKEILEKVFDKGDSPSDELDNKLYVFLVEIHKRLEIEKNALQLLVLVTRLVEEQYNVYEREEGVKVHPPLFQYFLEEKEGIFTYNQCCESIVDYCCNSRSEEEFCIYIKWIDLISRRLGKFPTRHKDYLLMVKDFAQKCLAQDDRGLHVLMNLSYKHFSCSVCEQIFSEKLNVVRVDNQENTDVSEVDRSLYFMELSKTLLIKPAGDIVADIVEESCKNESSLVLRRLRVNANKNTQRNCDDQSRGRKRNVKGETRLHILCRPLQDHPVPDVRKHVISFPNDVNVKDNFGNTPLHDCARNNKGNIIVTLMELYGRNKLNNVDFLARNESLETPLHLAATYCDPTTAEIFKHFAESCGVIDQVLTTANENGKLPFQLATNSQIQRKLTPRGYDTQSMLTHMGMTLDKDSVAELENCFELRKLLAWWSQQCV